MRPAVRVHDMRSFSVNYMDECTRVLHRIGIIQPIDTRELHR